MTTVELFDSDAEAIEYRLEPGSAWAVVIFHGGHMNARIALGEQVFRDLGYSVVAISRPGYGQTPLQPHRIREEFLRRCGRSRRFFRNRRGRGVCGLAGLSFTRASKEGRGRRPACFCESPLSSASPGCLDLCPPTAEGK